MRLVNGSPLAAAIFVLISLVLHAQDQTETSRSVKGGGITVPGWTGKIDANEERAGQALQNAKLAQEGNALHITTGPAVTYWNPANKATGNYTVKATFKEPKYMNLNSHPHPYGIVIAGNDLGTAQQSYLYCAAYGDGNFIVRGFGPQAFQMNGGGESNPAVNKARRPRTTRDSGDRDFRERRPRRLRDQRHRRCGLRQGRAGDRGKAQILRRRIWPSLRSQHGSHRHWFDDDEELAKHI